MCSMPLSALSVSTNHSTAPLAVEGVRIKIQFARAAEANRTTASSGIIAGFTWTCSYTWVHIFWYG